MKLLRTGRLAIVLMIAFPFFTRADSTSDKGAYTLFNPTPRDEMREWKTDRPGVSPFTVDAGHFEFDMVGVAYSHNSTQLLPFYHRTIDDWTYGSSLIKIGLFNRLDAEIGITPYEQATERSSFRIFRVIESSSTMGRFGDTSARLKWNLWGDDGGKTALSLSGVVVFPTESPKSFDDGYSGGPSLEFAAQLRWSLELRIDSQVILFEEPAHNLQQRYINLISLNRKLAGNLYGYGMFSADVQSGPDQFIAVQGSPGNPFLFVKAKDDWNGFASTGLFYRTGQCGELFAGCSFGVHGEFAADYAPFVGFAVRY